jgi:hypothetical protein
MSSIDENGRTVYTEEEKKEIQEGMTKSFKKQVNVWLWEALSKSDWIHYSEFRGEDNQKIKDIRSIRNQQVDISREVKEAVCSCDFDSIRTFDPQKEMEIRGFFNLDVFVVM